MKAALYEGIVYKVIYIYSSGFCEVQKEDSLTIKLVKKEELTFLTKENEKEGEL
jgi:hypothetical protein